MEQSANDADWGTCASRRTEFPARGPKLHTEMRTLPRLRASAPSAGPKKLSEALRDSNDPLRDGLLEPFEVGLQAVQVTLEPRQGDGLHGLLLEQFLGNLEQDVLIF
jgi:hypothetical protein